MNTMTFSQAATVLNTVVGQATGKTALTAINTPADFVAVAKTALETGRDPIINALSQVWSRTVFAVRDYTARLDALMMDMPRWGNALRKVSPISGEMIDDSRYEWPVAYDATHTGNELGNGQSVDMYKIAKQESLQTNFYGTAVYEQDYTIFRDQFDAAFNGPDEFARFNAMNLTERKNDRESYREGIARGLQANYIASIIDENQTGRVIHLLTEYNAATGLSLTATTVYQPANFAPFMRWVYARIKTLARMMGERSELFQTIINSKHILRHTPTNNMRIALYAPAIDQIETMVMSDTYHDNYLKGVLFEGVSYWQGIKTPDAINIKPVYTDTSGAVHQASTAVEESVFGLIHDRDAIGYAAVNDWAAPTPFNTKGGYYNEHYHSTFKTLMDMTEKGIVLLLD